MKLIEMYKNGYITEMECISTMIDRFSDLVIPYKSKNYMEIYKAGKTKLLTEIKEVTTIGLKRLKEK